MNRLKKLFILFKEKAHLTYLPGGLNDEDKYLGLRDEAMTEQQLMESIEFSGFVDGYEGTRSRYRSSKSSLLPKGYVPNIDPDSLDKIVKECHDVIREINDFETLGIESIQMALLEDKRRMENHLKTIEILKTPQRYNEFYRLGRSFFKYPLD